MILEHSKAKQSKTLYVISFTLFLFSLLYLYSELIFNTLMLDVAGTSFSDIRQIEDVQYYGRMISANGFTLLLLGLFAKIGFRLWKPSHWWLAIACIALCSIPMIMIFGESFYRTLIGDDAIEAGFDPEMGWALMIVPGAFLFLRSGGHNRSLIALGLIVMAWPAMFFGQKLIVERYLVAPTTSQDRLGARYVLMARAKSEECVMELGELDVCRAYMGDENIRSLNAMLAVLMLNARAIVLKDISAEKNDMLLKEVLSRDFDKIDEAYQQYLYKMQGVKKIAYRQYNKEKMRFIKYFYTPYFWASKQFYEAGSLPSEMIQMLDSFESEQLKAWIQYEIETSNYNTAIIGIASKLKNRLTQFRNEAYNCDDLSCENDKLLMLRYFQREHGEDLKTLETMCKGNPLEYNCQMTKADIVKELHNKKDPEFIDKSGYMPDIKTKEEFLSLSQNQDILRERVKLILSQKIKGINFEITPLPNNITRETLEAFLKKKVARHAEVKWMQEGKKRFGKYIAPGLSLEEFFKALNIKMPQNIKQELPVLSKKEFVDRYVLPSYKTQVVEYFDSIEKEAPQYANKESLSRQGKNYIRAIYIPPIAIGLSLFIVAITIGKNIIFIGSSLSSILFKKKRFFNIPSVFLYVGTWLILLFAVVLFINSQENSYIENNTYHRYYQASYSRSPTVTIILDSIIRTQPTIYRWGSSLLELTK